ncbi:MAG: hypothetical protein QNJ85_18095 [Gammaproteobacteria bacterium]|nr:hypothetical protein [Gammaproteobacteria bacterium]
MNYLEAKTEILRETKPMPLHLIAIEAAVLVTIATFLVKMFA